MFDTGESDDADHKWLTSKELAHRLGLSEGTLRKWRHYEKKNQPPYSHVGGAIRYRWGDVRAWLADNQGRRVNYQVLVDDVQIPSPEIITSWVED